MQQQEKMRKQEGPLQQPVIDAEDVQLQHTEQTISDLDTLIAELRKTIWPLRDLHSNPADGSGNSFCE